MATRQWLALMADEWRRSTGRPVRIESVGGVDAARRVEAGEGFDLVVLAEDAMARLDALGALQGTVQPVATSVMAVALPAHGSPEDVATQAQLTALLCGVDAIGYSTGPSGKALLALLEGWGLLAELQPRLLQAPPGRPVSEMVAQGRVKVGFQQRSELVFQRGIVVAPMPPGAEVVTVFAAAVGRRALQPEAAQVFLGFLQSPRAEAALAQQGFFKRPN
jgi:molybdate transport system substrate-binding protein